MTHVTLPDAFLTEDVSTFFHDSLEKSIFTFLVEKALGDQIGATPVCLARAFQLSLYQIYRYLERLYLKQFIKYRHLGRQRIYYVPLYPRLLNTLIQELFTLHTKNTEDPVSSFKTYETQLWKQYVEEREAELRLRYAKYFPFEDALEQQLFCLLWDRARRDNVGASASDLLHLADLPDPSLKHIACCLQRLYEKDLVKRQRVNSDYYYAVPLHLHLFNLLIHSILTVQLNRAEPPPHTLESATLPPWIRDLSTKLDFSSFPVHYSLSNLAHVHSFERQKQRLLAEYQVKALTVLEYSADDLFTFINSLQGRIFFELWNWNSTLKGKIELTVETLAKRLKKPSAQVLRQLDQLTASHLVLKFQHNNQWMYHVPAYKNALQALIHDLTSHLTHSDDLTECSLGNYETWLREHSFTNPQTATVAARVNTSYPFRTPLAQAVYFLLRDRMLTGQFGLLTTDLLNYILTNWTTDEISYFQVNRARLYQCLCSLEAGHLIRRVRIGKHHIFYLPLYRDFAFKLLHQLALIQAQDDANAGLSVEEVTQRTWTKYLTDIRVVFGHPEEDWDLFSLSPLEVINVHHPRVKKLYDLFNTLTQWFAPTLLSPLTRPFLTRSHLPKLNVLLPRILGYVEASLRATGQTISWCTLGQINETFGSTLTKQDYLKYVFEARQALQLVLLDKYTLTKCIAVSLLEERQLSPKVSKTARQAVGDLLQQLECQQFDFKDAEIMALAVIRLVLNERGKINALPFLRDKIVRLLHRIRQQLNLSGS